MRPDQRVLIIDDERNFSHILCVKLTQCGFTVDVAHDAVHGLEMLLDSRFDLVLLDVRLPDVDGIDALPRLRAAARGAPFVIVTAYEDDALRARAQVAGAAEVLYKPFDLDLLVHTVSRHIAPSGRPAQVGSAVAQGTEAGTDASSVDSSCRDSAKGPIFSDRAALGLD